MRSMGSEDPRFLHADSDYSDQPGHPSDWADAQADLSLAGRTCHFVGFVMRRLKYFSDY